MGKFDRDCTKLCIEGKITAKQIINANPAAVEKPNDSFMPLIQMVGKATKSYWLYMS